MSGTFSSVIFCIPLSAGTVMYSILALTRIPFDSQEKEA